MAATYSLSGNSLLNIARFLFHDVGGFDADTGLVSKPLLQDEEYLRSIAVFGDREGLAKAAIALASTFEQKVQQYANTRGGTSVAWPQRGEFYLKLAADIRQNGVNAVVDMALATVIALPRPYPTLAPDGSIREADDRLVLL